VTPFLPPELLTTSGCGAISKSKHHKINKENIEGIELPTLNALFFLFYYADQAINAILKKHFTSGKNKPTANGSLGIYSDDGKAGTAFFLYTSSPLTLNI
jgi:hypothetical protein